MKLLEQNYKSQLTAKNENIPIIIYSDTNIDLRSED